MSRIANEDKSTTWRKEPYVWMIIFFPVLAIVGGIITTFLAVKSNDGLVVDDYYKKGLEINRTIERDNVANDYELKADINIDEGMGEIAITLSADSHFDYPEKLPITFLHATRSGLDRETKLILTGENIYRGQLTKLNSGKWYVYIQQDDWRLIEVIVIK